MAKKQKNGLVAHAEPVAGGAGLPSAPASPAGSSVEIVARPDVAPTRTPAPGPAGWLEPVGDTLVGSVQVVRGLLPASRLPMFLASTALVVTGVLDPPVALGLGLAFEALRRWEPAPRR